MFKVVPDQLKISDGWVRCGHCADVFDATLYLEAWVPPPAPVPPPVPSRPESRRTPPPPVSETPDPAPAPAAQSGIADGDEAAVSTIADALLDASDGPAHDTVDVDLPSANVLAILAPEAEAEAALSNAPTQAPMGPGQADAASSADEADGGWLVRPGAATTPSASEPDADAEPWDTVADLPLATLPDVRVAEAARADAFQAELARFAEASGRPVSEAPAPAVPNEIPATPAFLEPEDVVAVHEAGEPGFMRQARRQAFWRSPAVRSVLGLVAVVLGLVLLVQWALHERDPLAARHPALAPLLAQLCEPLGCSVGPVQRIDAVVIDSSTLVRRLGNFYAFDVVLKNNADIPLAVPALELSLTDTRDSVMARRVFLPQELPGAPRVLPARSTQPLSLRLSISDVGGVPMAGYRALVFYP